MNFDGNFDFVQPSKKTTMPKLCVSTSLLFQLFLTTSEPSESGADFGRNRSKIFSSKDLELGQAKEEPSLKLRHIFFAMSVRKYQFRFEWRPLKKQWMIELILTQ